MTEQGATEEPIVETVPTVVGADELAKSRVQGQLLVPTDFSPESSVALTLAIELARKLGARIELLHVYGLPIYAAPPLTDVVGVTAIPPEVLSTIGAELDGLCKKVRDAGVDCDTAFLVGTAPDVIVQRAVENGARMIIMGTHGRSGLKRAVLGSVAEKVVQKARCPVVVVPPPARVHGDASA